MTERHFSGPAFILCAARSGSTLLRQVLDAHPQIACPPELNLAVAFDNILFSFRNSYIGDEREARAMAMRACRRLARETAGEYARLRGKQWWCDKSLSAIVHAELLTQVFPSARFICLYRRCTDMIVSAIEASPWGYSGGYGFEKYVQSAPENEISALAQYWIDTVGALLSFEGTHKPATHRLRYEDLVLTPAAAVSSLCGFLDISWEDSFIDPGRVLRDSSSYHPGDYKIRYTRQFETSSVGRGWNVPLELIPETLQEQINEINVKLGYPALESAAYRFADSGGNLDISDINAPSDSSTASSVFKLIRERLSDPGGTPPEQGVGPAIRIALADRAEPWIIDLRARTISEGRGEADFSIMTDAVTLQDIAAGRRNAAVELRHSRVRLTSERPWPYERFLQHFDAVVDLLTRNSSIQS